MTTISIEAYLPEQEAPRPRKMLAFGFVRLKLRSPQNETQSKTQPSNYIEDDLSVLGMLVVEEDGKFNPTTL